MNMPDILHSVASPNTQLGQLQKQIQQFSNDWSSSGFVGKNGWACSGQGSLCSLGVGTGRNLELDGGIMVQVHAAATLLSSVELTGLETDFVQIAVIQGTIFFIGFNNTLIFPRSLGDKISTWPAEAREVITKLLNCQCKTQRHSQDLGQQSRSFYFQICQEFKCQGTLTQWLLKAANLRGSRSFEGGMATEP